MTKDDAREIALNTCKDITQDKDGIQADDRLAAASLLLRYAMEADPPNLKNKQLEKS